MELDIRGMEIINIFNRKSKNYTHKLTILLLMNFIKDTRGMVLRRFLWFLRKRIITTPNIKY